MLSISQMSILRDPLWHRVASLDSLAPAEYAPADDDEVEYVVLDFGLRSSQLHAPTMFNKFQLLVCCAFALVCQVRILANHSRAQGLDTATPLFSVGNNIFEGVHSETLGDAILFAPNPDAVAQGPSPRTLSLAALPLPFQNTDLDSPRAIYTANYKVLGTARTHIAFGPVRLVHRDDGKGTVAAKRSKSAAGKGKASSSKLDTPARLSDDEDQVDELEPDSSGETSTRGKGKGKAKILPKSKANIPVEGKGKAKAVKAVAKTTKEPKDKVAKDKTPKAKAAKGSKVDSTSEEPAAPIVAGPRVKSVRTRRVSIPLDSE